MDPCFYCLCCFHPYNPAFPLVLFHSAPYCFDHYVTRTLSRGTLLFSVLSTINLHTGREFRGKRENAVLFSVPKIELLERGEYRQHGNRASPHTPFFYVKGKTKVSIVEEQSSCFVCVRQMF